MEWIMVLAIVAGPILAVQVQKFIENKKEKRGRKLQIFKALMATRATPLYPAHVEALNMIDIEFYKNKKIVDTWKLLHDNFANYPKDPKAKDYEIKLASCSENSNDLLTDLLYEMSTVLGYNFDKVLLKRGCYIPKGHGDFQLEQDFIRKGLLHLLWGNKPLSIKVVEVEKVPPSQQNKENESKEENKNI